MDSISPRERLREQVHNLTNQVWIEGRRDEDGLDRYVDQILKLCSEEAQKIVPPECGEAIRNLFENGK